MSRKLEILNKQGSLNNGVVSGSFENIKKIVNNVGREKVQEIIYQSQSKTHLCRNLGINVNSKCNAFSALKRLGFNMEFKPQENNSILTSYTKEDLQERLNNCKSWRAFFQSLGYKSFSLEYIERIKALGLNTSFIDSSKSICGENLKKEELERVVKESKIWQTVYRYFNCRTNEEKDYINKCIKAFNINTLHLENKSVREVVTDFSKEELKKIISTSVSWGEVSAKLGFSKAGEISEKVKEFVLEKIPNAVLQTNDLSAIPNLQLRKIKQRPLRFFEEVVLSSKNWRNLIHNINEEYETSFDDTAYKRIKRLVENLDIDTSHFDVRDEKSKLNEDEFKERLKDIFGDKIVLIGPFIDMKTETVFKCLEHGEFYKKPIQLLKGSNCPKCIESRGEMAVRAFLEKNKITFVTQKTFPDCRNQLELPFDFYLPDYNTCIEFQGTQHLRPVRFYGCSEEQARISYERTIRNDKIKKKYCQDKNISLIEIFEAEEISEILGLLIKDKNTTNN